MKKVLMIIMVVAMFAGTSFVSNAESKAVCNHPTSATNHSTVNEWYTTHSYVVSYNPTKTETCRVRHWVERVTSYCPTCAYTFGYQDLNHETHSKCNASF